MSEGNRTRLRAHRVDIGAAVAQSRKRNRTADNYDFSRRFHDFQNAGDAENPPPAFKGRNPRSVRLDAIESDLREALNEGT